MQQDIAQTSPSRLSEAQRAEALVLYELGLFNRAQLARHYGVRREVIDRHLKAVGAVKGRRMGARIDQLNASIDARQEARRGTRRETEARRREAAKSNLAFLDRFMDALLKAEREGRLVEFGQRLSRL
jgi:hypothetical protein